jgi:hypothetical protein
VVLEAALGVAAAEVQPCDARKKRSWTAELFVNGDWLVVDGPELTWAEAAEVVVEVVAVVVLSTGQGV